MVKKAVIVISLVKQSVKMANKDIEREILDALTGEQARIPWLREIEKVTVTEK